MICGYLISTIMADSQQSTEASRVMTHSEKFQALKDKESDVRKQMKELESKKQEEFDVIREKYAPQVKVLTDAVDDIRREREACLKDLLGDPESLAFNGWENATHKEIRTMPITNLEFLVYKVSGETNKFSTVPGTTDVATPHDRKVNAIKFLIRSGCTYCHCLFHNINDCPTRKPCHKCGEMGHSSKRCRSK